MAEVIKLGGYSGGASIADAGVLLTSGSITNTLNPSYVSMIGLPNDNTHIGPVLHASGTETYTASLNFEMYSGSGSLFSEVIKRRNEISFSMNDGYNHASGSGYVTSGSFSVSSGGIITGSLNLICLNSISFDPAETENTYLGSEIPLGYWISGSSSNKISEWSFQIEQNARPVYANKDETKPHYIRVGDIVYTLSVTSYDQIKSTIEADAAVSLTLGIGGVTLKGSITEAGYSYNGAGTLGSYHYVFKTGSNNGTSNLEVLETE